MKNIVFTIFITGMVLISSYSFGRESVPDYYITKSSADAMLSKTEAVFVFHFPSYNDRFIGQNIKLSCNGINKTIQPDTNKNITIKVKPGKYLFRFFYTEDFFEITTSSINIKPAYRTEIAINFKPSKIPITEDKPVIYIYPEKTSQIHVQLDVKGKIGFTYPAYDNGWNFTADPDGTIYMNGKKYHYLFWEGMTKLDKNKINWNEGFIVDRKNLISFFEKKLSEMGLQSSEIADFITYWCPLMNKNEKNYVHFLFNETYNEYATLHVNPKPDNIFRVFMLWSKADEKKQAQVKAQPIPSFIRKGFTVVEWGGAQQLELDQ